MRIPRLFVAVAALSLLAAGACAVDGGFQCPDGMEPFTELNVYFGLGKSDGSTISEREWRGFLADTVTPRFPDGLTVLDARGQWFDTAEGRIYRESTKLLYVLVPIDTNEASVNALREISEVYKRHFDQQAVLHTTSPACAEVY